MTTNTTGGNRQKRTPATQGPQPRGAKSKPSKKLHVVPSEPVYENKPLDPRVTYVVAFILYSILTIVMAILSLAAASDQNMLGMFLWLAIGIWGVSGMIYSYKGYKKCSL